MVDDECDRRTEDEMEEMRVARVLRQRWSRPHLIRLHLFIRWRRGVSLRSVSLREVLAHMWSSRVHDARILLVGSCGWWRRVVNELREVRKVTRLEGG
jgi:hypothetical protein